MAWPIFEKLGGMLGNRPDKPEPLGEVSVTTCGLVDVDEGACARLGAGDELPMSIAPDGRVAVGRASSKLPAPLGYLPEREGPHVARLMEGRAPLGCRVVHARRGQGQPVRVRIYIKM